MAKKAHLSEAEAQFLLDALTNAEADKAFLQLAAYLKKNDLQLSDQILQRYVADELFACFSGRGDLFTAALHAQTR
ncbi:hypothetical protein [Litoreibacter roseus]|uniref:Uncharacterized protein n=1 Tax=Litoreibacter roseus TaxID=2601869 RepID=A0A6N6JNK6_9RHOB|nr:hypothetical protein [Litoreibacter roseus]GFE67028.1 hypothetical protein KIN_41020 [Litoreibacter roseus]